MTVNTDEDDLFGYYLSSSKTYDDIVVASPDYLIVISAGNDRNDSFTGTHDHFDGGVLVSSTDVHPIDGTGVTPGDGFDSLPGGIGTAKNTLTIGAVNDIPNGYVQPSDVVLTSFSSIGPIDDGRIKPDLVANGASLFSSTSASDVDYSILSGTSMASPNTSGSIGLLLQHAENLFGAGFVYKASTMKALVLHTADEAGPGPGPDYSFGWGLLNTNRAAQVMFDEAGTLNTFHIKEVNYTGSTVMFLVESDGSKPLCATIAWTDLSGTPPAGGQIDPPDIMLMNDMDLRITDPSLTVHDPWVLDPLNPANAATNGDNMRDNVEQVLIQNPVAGSYSIAISNKGVVNSQVVSLIVTGNVDIGLASVGDFVWDDEDGNGIQNGGELGLNGITVRLLDNADQTVATTTTSGGGLYGFNNLAPASYSVEFVAPAGLGFTQQDQGGDDSLDSDADPVTGRTIQFTLAAGLPDIDWDAGLVQGGLPEIDVNPNSLTFNIPINSTDKDTLIISNLAIPGADNLNWFIAETDNGATSVERPKRVSSLIASPLQQVFVLTSRFLRNLADDRAFQAMPHHDTVLGKLGTLKEQEFFGKEQFVDVLKTTVDIERYNRFLTLLVGYAERKYQYKSPDAADVVEETNSVTKVKLDRNFKPNPFFVSSLLYDNGPLVNSSGTGVGGADESILQSVSLGMNSLGFGHQALNGNRVADDFTVNAAGGWQVDSLCFYAYQTNSTSTSTITAVNYRIWDGPPGDPGSSIVFGDMTTNRLSKSEWSNVYRVSETTSGTSSARPIMLNIVSAGFTLTSGVYWVDWQSDGTLTSGPWAPPITITGIAGTGNGEQSTDAGVSYGPALDSGTGTPQQGFPFTIFGEVAVDECPWLTFTPLFGTTSAGQSDSVCIEVDATGLSPGIYNCTLAISSNDPDESSIQVPVQLNVTGGGPFLAFRVERSTGDVFANGSFTSGGADLAEHINVSEILEPGDIVELDSSKPGHYRKARRNSQLIAGVITTEPGFILGNELAVSREQLLEDDLGERHMLALLGRVPVKATTENGPIRPGDLLTLSSKPGYAMKCNSAKTCEGMIIGKALEALASGDGKIVVLVMSP